MSFWRILQVAVSIALIAWLVTSIDRAALANLALINPITLVFAALLFASAQIFGGLRLATLFAGELSRRDAITATWIGYFLANFLPGTIGGDIARAVRLTASGLTLTASAGGLVLDRLLNTAALMLVALVTAGPLVLGVVSSFAPVAILSVAAGAIAIFLAGVVAARRSTRFEETVASIARPLTMLVRSPARFAATVVLSFLNIGVALVAQWIIARALGIPLGLAEVAGIACLVTLLVMAPISLNGLGLQEASYVVMLTRAGASEESAIAFAITVRLIIVFASLIGGVILASESLSRSRRA